MDNDYEVIEEPTPDEEHERLVKEYGIFADTEITVNPVDKTVTVDLDKCLPGKSSITVKTEMANAGWMLFNDVADTLAKSCAEIKAKR